MYIHDGILFILKYNGNAVIGDNMDGSREYKMKWTRHRKTKQNKTMCSNLHVQSKNVELMKTWNRIVVIGTWSRCRGNGEMPAKGWKFAVRQEE
jgi:hypothetical protein